MKGWQVGKNLLCLRIELADGKQFILPYGYFEGAQLEKESEFDVMHVRFKAASVLLKGIALAELLDAFQTLSVKSLKACPPRYKPLVQGIQGIISDIEVRETSE